MSAPFLLKPAGKDYLWGGSRLKEGFGKDLALHPLAETWECSTHPDGPSRCATGEDLRQVLERHPGWLGTHVLELTGGRAELPILIKFIDAKEDLSIQVHPDDEYALRVEGQLGKTELWYVVDAAPEAQILCGFHRTVAPEEVRSAVEAGTLARLMNRVAVRKNDAYYIPAGTVHAIGAGTVIAEVQENSNLIYRLFDYDRTDAQGNRRPLHIDRALDVANLEGGAALRRPMRVLRYRSGCATELLARCRYFIVERMLLNTSERGLPVPYETGATSFHALLCIEGGGRLEAEGSCLEFGMGDCVFVPAESGQMQLHGAAQLLDVSC